MLKLPVVEARLDEILPNRSKLKYSLRDVPMEQLQTMIENVGAASKAIAANLLALLEVSMEARVSERVWKLAVDAADRELTFAGARRTV